MAVTRQRDGFAFVARGVFPGKFRKATALFIRQLREHVPGLLCRVGGGICADDLLKFYFRFRVQLVVDVEMNRVQGVVGLPVGVGEVVACVLLS